MTGCHRALTIAAGSPALEGSLIGLRQHPRLVVVPPVPAQVVNARSAELDSSSSPPCSLAVLEMGTQADSRRMRHKPQVGLNRLTSTAGRDAWAGLTASMTEMMSRERATTSQHGTDQERIEGAIPPRQGLFPLRCGLLGR